MIVAIDGPAGAGKSSVAKKLADQLGFAFLDTGAMYRAVTLAGIRRSWDFSQEREVAEATAQLNYAYFCPGVHLDDVDITAAIRDPNVTRQIHHAADNPYVRQVLVGWQRDWAAGKDLVTEGRDQGTVVFPNAECKIFLTASETERARRRWWELQRRGETITLDEVLADQKQRDGRDTARVVGALRRAEDAAEVTTDGLTLEQVLSELTVIVDSKRPRHF
jgi:cytidylate kinase